MASLTEARLQADKERYATTLREKHKWQQPAESRATSSTQLLCIDVVNHGRAQDTPLLARALAALGSCSATRAKVQWLTSARISAIRGSEVALVQVPQNKPPQSAPGTFILKVGNKDRILREADNLHWACSVLGSNRLPRLLTTTLQAEGAAALVLEEVRFILETSGAGTRTSSLTDYLVLGTARFALEDLRASWAAASALPDLPAVEFEARPPDLQAVVGIASQAAELISALAKHPLEEEAAPHALHALQMLLELVPLLERHLLGRHRSTASPLHESVRHLTEARYSESFNGEKVASVLESGETLHARLTDIRPSALRGEPCFPTIEVPLVWCHGRFGVAHLLLRSVESGMELCATSWSGLGVGALYGDLAAMLTSIAFETVRIPFVVEELPVLFSPPGEAGPTQPSQLCALHLRVSETTAARLLQGVSEEQQRQRLIGDSPTGENETEQSMRELLAMVEGSTEDRGAGHAPETDVAYLLSWLRSSRRPAIDAAAEARKISDALCDWTLPRRAVRVVGRSGGIARPLPTVAARQRGETPIRSMQWGWQVVREFRDAAAAVLPVVEGDISEVWPLLWLVPSLKLSLELLDCQGCAWPQKVWLLYHVRSLADRLVSWLEKLAKAQNTLSVSLVKTP
uniref:Uncharacterized protein n=1 Tax=Noctiluca scintillans TaxID=2966 RepID=A0A7S1AJ54_NOCSC|mmetsp:Transcript_48463/g.128360  ORF Transcript_48463/g.128360 Transcript_48463/m.128360 type:complete len:635 (+) Transcript_48463:58-1962(+)